MLLPENVLCHKPHWLHLFTFCCTVHIILVYGRQFGEEGLTLSCQHGKLKSKDKETKALI